ncbi:MAG: alpha/beta fold hydrolase [Gemmatimonadaceae bacterium]
MKRFARIVGWIVVLLLLIAAGFYVSRDLERQTLDATARASAPGKFVQLSDGTTHYDLSGPDSSRTVVLLSGFSVPFYIWDPTRDALAANGFRVLRYDYFGRGYSDRPKLRYDLATYDNQLTELLDSLGISGTVDVAGLSMGGAIAANFSDRHPDRVRTLTLVDPGIGVFAETPFPVSVPVLAEFALTVGASETAKGQLTDFLHPERYPDWVKRYEPQMRYKGFRRAMIRTMRGDVFKRPVSSFTTLVQGQIPILLIWGKADRTVPFAMSDSVRAALPRAEFHAIDGASHLPHIEQAALVDSMLIRFLRAH